MRSISNRNSINFIIVPLLLLILQSCGYALKDEVSFFSEKRIGVIAEPSLLNREFTGILKESNLVKRITNTDLSNYDLIIRILNHKITKYSSAMGSGARVREARIDHLIRISMNEQDSPEEIYEIESTRFFKYSDSNILSTESEEKNIVSNMMRLSLERLELSASARSRIK